MKMECEWRRRRGEVGKCMCLCESSHRIKPSVITLIRINYYWNAHTGNSVNGLGRLCTIFVIQCSLFHWEIYIIGIVRQECSIPMIDFKITYIEPKQNKNNKLRRKKNKSGGYRIGALLHVLCIWMFTPVARCAYTRCAVWVLILSGIIMLLSQREIFLLVCLFVFFNLSRHLTLSLSFGIFSSDGCDWVMSPLGAWTHRCSARVIPFVFYIYMCINWILIRGERHCNVIVCPSLCVHGYSTTMSSASIFNFSLIIDFAMVFNSLSVH